MTEPPDVVLTVDDADDEAIMMVQPPRNHSAGNTPLRRESPLVSPTAAIRRGADDRPRSQPRTRTPMRYESPLNANAFRETNEGQRISIRPLAGAAVGSALRTSSVREERRRDFTTRSSKQGPSHRKIRRWNNDNFVGIAAEVAQASARGPVVAEALLLAQADAPLYRSIYNPGPPTTALTTMINDSKFDEIRSQFFEGEFRHGGPINVQHKRPATPVALPPSMLKRIHQRLYKVLERACQGASRNIVDEFEVTLVRCFGGSTTTLAADTLLETPTVTKRKSGQTVVKFYFEAETQHGGFHRLILHGISQFHGLTATSTSIATYNGKSARLLTVVGLQLVGPGIKLSKCMLDAEQLTAGMERLKPFEAQPLTAVTT